MKPNLEPLKREIRILELNIEERHAWLILPRRDRESRPKFSNSYTVKSLDSAHRRDRVAESNLKNKAERMELSVCAKKEIRRLKRKMNKDIEIEVDLLTANLRVQFDINPLFKDLSSEDIVLVYEDHDNECKRVKTKIRRDANEEIERITQLDRAPKSVKGCSDREEMSFIVTSITEEQRLLRQFETYIVKRTDLTDAEVTSCRDEHIAKVKKEMQVKSDKWNAERDRRVRLERAKIISYDNEEYLKMMYEYTERMEETIPQCNPSVDWPRTLSDLDSTFLTTIGQWNRFLNVVIYYWTLLARPEDQEQFDSLISKYIILELERRTTTGCEELMTLTSERDELILQVRRLDTVISEMTGKIKTRDA